MTMNELLERIITDPKIMTGKPTIKNTRITVDVILELLAAGMKPEEIAEDYKLDIKDIMAALYYAAMIIGREEILIEART